MAEIDPSPSPDDVIITLRPVAGGSSTIEIDRLRDGSYRATHRAGMGTLELCRTADLERLLRQLNEALVTGRSPATSPPCATCTKRSSAAPPEGAVATPRAGGATGEAPSLRGP